MIAENKGMMLSEPKSYKWSRLIHCHGDQAAEASPHGTIERLSSTYLRSALNQPLINYYFTDQVSSNDEQIKHFYPYSRPIAVDEPSVLFPIALVNAGHAQCQVIGYFNILSKNPELSRHKICISSAVVEKLPFVYQLILLLFGKNRVTILETSSTYYFTSIWLMQSRYSLVIKPSRVTVQLKDGYQHLHLGGDPATAYTEDPSCVLNLSRDLSGRDLADLQIHEKLFFVKTEGIGGRMNSPSRAISLDHDTQNLIIERGFKIVHITDFSCLAECITTLHHAKKVVTSWGNIATSNRFFYSYEAQIVLLGNEGYANEYKSIPSDGFLGIATFPVLNQFVVRDFPDKPRPTDIVKVLDIIDS